MALTTAECGAVILCGGASRRMGTCKGLLTLDGRTILSRLIGELSDFDERLLSANDPSLARGLDLKPVADVYPGAGPGAGLHAALLASSHEALLCLPCDLPCFTAEAARILLSHFPEGRAAMVCRDGAGRLHPLCGIYTRAALPALERRLRSGSCPMRAVAADVGAAVLDTAPLLDDRVFFNMNTPEDYRQVCRER